MSVKYIKTDQWSSLGRSGPTADLISSTNPKEREAEPNRPDKVPHVYLIATTRALKP